MSKNHKSNYTVKYYRCSKIYNAKRIKLKGHVLRDSRKFNKIYGNKREKFEWIPDS
jgi:hypothetical protein